MSGKTTFSSSTAGIPAEHRGFVVKLQESVKRANVAKNFPQKWLCGGHLCFVVE